MILSGHAMAAEWYGMERDYGNEAGCAMDYAKPDAGALLLQTGIVEPNFIHWRGRMCVLSLSYGDFDYAVWMANCHEAQPDLRRWFVTKSVEGEPEALRLHGGDGTDNVEWKDLGIIRPC